jgi:hypothetical protein
MDAHFSPEAHGDMGHHDWDPCELHPQTERFFDAHGERIDWLPGLTDVASSCITAPYSPTLAEVPTGYEEEVLPPGFWKPNMLYETKAWWHR